MRSRGGGAGELSVAFTVCRLGAGAGSCALEPGHVPGHVPAASNHFCEGVRDWVRVQSTENQNSVCPMCWVCVLCVCVNLHDLVVFVKAVDFWGLYSCQVSCPSILFTFTSL